MISLMCNGVFTQEKSYPFWMNEQMPCIEHYLKDSCVHNPFAKNNKPINQQRFECNKWHFSTKGEKRL